MRVENQPGFPPFSTLGVSDLNIVFKKDKGSMKGGLYFYSGCFVNTGDQQTTLASSATAGTTDGKLRC